MRDFPDSLPIKTLQACHPDYTARMAALQCIDDLCVGGHQIEAKKRQYLKKRPGEDPKLYEIRLDRFTYTNVLGQAISQQVSKLKSGSLSVNAVDYDEAFWQQFREDTNRDGRDEDTLLSEVLRCGLKFQQVYLQVDKPAIAVQPQNKAQEEALGIRPYVLLYDARHAINYGPEWVKFRQFNVVSDPLAVPVHQATWKFVTDEAIAVYQAFVRFNAEGKIVAILDDQGNEKESVDPEKTLIKRSRLVLHGLGRMPVVRCDIPDDLWATNQCYLKALEHLNLENSRYDTSMMSGYVQRTYEPFRQPDNDLGETFVDAEDEIDTGNAFIVKGSFGFSEATGSAVKTVSEHLQELRSDIRDIIGLGGNASATREAVQQSGTSKKMDFVIQEMILRSYGSILTATYQDLLQMVGAMAGHDRGRLDEISCSGFDSFDVDSLDSAIEVSELISTFEDRLPPTALKLWWQSVSLLLARNANADQRQAIADEIERIFGVDFDAEDDEEGDEELKREGLR